MKYRIQSTAQVRKLQTKLQTFPQQSTKSPHTNPQRLNFDANQREFTIEMRKIPNRDANFAAETI